MGEIILKIIYKIRLSSNGIFLLLLGLKVKGIPLVDNQFRLYGLSNITIGRNFRSGVSLRLQNIDANSKIEIGDNVNFNDRVHIASKNYVKIGNGCLFASNILVTDHGHGIENSEIAPAERDLDTEPTLIGKNVWIGENSVIYKGVTIGNGAVIGANSFVNKDVPEGTIFAGVPAKKIK
jgi:acetyltransferase-like isoleucine patch superfamily enzyme